MTTRFSITGGPSKWELASGLFSRKPHHIVTFIANAPIYTSVEIVVTSVQAQDDTGESWNIEGYVTHAWRPHNKRQDLFTPKPEQRVFVHFRTDDRQGSIRFFEKKAQLALSELDEIVRQSNERQFGDGRPVRL